MYLEQSVVGYTSGTLFAGARSSSWRKLTTLDLSGNTLSGGQFCVNPPAGLTLQKAVFVYSTIQVYHLSESRQAGASEPLLAELPSLLPSLTSLNVLANRLAGK